MGKKAVALVLAVVGLALLFACSKSEQEQPENFVLSGREMPRLVALIPESPQGEIYGIGYGYFSDQLKADAGQYRFQYQIERFDGAQELASLIETAQCDYLYVHSTYDPALAAALNARQEQGVKIILFGDALDDFKPDYHIYIDYAGMGRQAAQYINQYFAERLESSGTLAVAMLGQAQNEEQTAYFNALETALASEFELLFIQEEDVGAQTAQVLEQMDLSDAARLCCGVALDAPSANAFMQSVLQYNKTLALQVELIGFTGVQDDEINRIAYSPIDLFTCDMSPSLMITAAKYCAQCVSGEKTQEMPLQATLIDKFNVESYKLSDEYLIRLQ